MTSVAPSITRTSQSVCAEVLSGQVARLAATVALSGLIRSSITLVPSGQPKLVSVPDVTSCGSATMQAEELADSGRVALAVAILVLAVPVAPWVALPRARWYPALLRAVG